MLLVAGLRRQSAQQGTALMIAAWTPLLVSGVQRREWTWRPRPRHQHLRQRRRPVTLALLLMPAVHAAHHGSVWQRSARIGSSAQCSGPLGGGRRVAEQAHMLQ